MRYRVSDEYFDWLVTLVTQDRFSKHISFNKLFTQLHNTIFTYTIPLDRNRACDGVHLRYRFLKRKGYHDTALDELGDEASVLEVMIALSIRCEEYITDDPMYGDRTSQWFWNMIASLGLNGSYDTHYDERYVDMVLSRFLNREYEPDGEGGLFTIRHCTLDLTKVEIWLQLLRYLNTVALCDDI